MRQLSELVINVTRKNRRESLHDGLTVKEEAAARFDLGLLDLSTKARVEDAYWHLISKISTSIKMAARLPRKFANSKNSLGANTCATSASSILDRSLGTETAFPHRPHPSPQRSPDPSGSPRRYYLRFGRKNRSLCRWDRNSQQPSPSRTQWPTLPTRIFPARRLPRRHGRSAQPFGSVNEAHVYLDPDEPDGFYIEETIPGFSIGRVLGNVQYEPSQLSRMIKSQVDDAIKQDKMKATEGMDLLDSYEKGLSHPTYLSLETP